ncbi:polysaccharide deacetylase family protein [Neorhizobium sp. NCHU2750]|uniref:polysaccharide deacetylase family protein n=1 Tax=Neorhizobium sp. NCHU2750 TaxID=1825976 RepID=UPI000E7717E6|nr:polysaccharide deacetylase [Neorhizobium sp. NCHU2750]
MSRNQFIAQLDRYAEAGRTAEIWLRDDDAIEPTELLSRLLGLSAAWDVPMTIAAIPAHATPALAALVSEMMAISIAVHGWDHTNYAPTTEKKQELGLHRGEDAVLELLAEGIIRIRHMFGARAIPLLVPPWNRIAPALIGRLADLGYEALSVFGPERTGAPLPMVNTHVDIIDWKGSRGGRAADVLYAEAAARLSGGDAPETSLGILTHHLVHDDAAWAFLDDFLALTAGHPACCWVAVKTLMERT